MIFRALYALAFLLLVGASLPVALLQAQSGDLVACEPLKADLEGDSLDLAFEGNNGNTVTISARPINSSIDLTLELLFDGARVAFNDDHGSDRRDLQRFDPLLNNVKLSETGLYIVRVVSLSSGPSGDVRVLLESACAQGEGQPTPDETNASAPTSQPDSTATALPTATTSGTNDGGEVIEGEVPENDSFRTPIEALNGEALTITVRAVDNVLDPRLELLDESGNVLAENDDHTSDDPSLGRLDSQIADYIVTTDSPLFVRVRGFSGTGGRFEMTIEREDAQFVVTSTPVPSPTFTPLPPDDTDHTEVEVVINPNDNYRYDFIGEPGDVYVITMRALDDELDAHISLYYNDEDLITGSEDHGTSDPTLGFYDARISNVILPFSGTYQVYASGYRESSGTALLTVDRIATGAPISAGNEEVRMGEVETNNVTREEVELEAGDYVTVTVRALTTGYDPQLTIVSPSGVLVADNDDHGTNASNLGFLDSRVTNYRVLEDGTYTLEITGYRSSAGTYAVTMNILQ